MYFCRILMQTLQYILDMAVIDLQKLPFNQLVRILYSCNMKCFPPYSNCLCHQFHYLVYILFISQTTSLNQRMIINVLFNDVRICCYSLVYLN